MALLGFTTHSLEVISREYTSAFDSSTMSTVDATDEDSTWVDGSLQQWPMKKVHLLPDGKRSTDAKLFLTTSELTTQDDINQTIGDIVIYNDERYKAWDSYDWTGHNLLIDHNRYLLIRIDDEDR